MSGVSWGELQRAHEKEAGYADQEAGDGRRGGLRVQCRGFVLDLCEREALQRGLSYFSGVIER